jgi:hypothetical protein
MIKAVEGYLTKDGRFFENALFAEANEAEEALRKQMETDGYSADLIDQALHGIEKYLPLVSRLVQAKQELLKPVESHNAKSDQASAKRPKGANYSPKSRPSISPTDSSIDSPDR